MQLKYVDGCVCTSLTADGVETVDMPIERLRGVVKSLFKLEYDNQGDGKSDMCYYMGEIIDATNTSSMEHYDDDVECYMTAYARDVNGVPYRHVDVYFRDLLFIGCEIFKYEVKKLEEGDFLNLCGLVDEITDVAVLQGMFCHTMQKYGKYECSDSPCDCCGDWIRTYTLPLEEYVMPGRGGNEIE